jgi:hypothetical protein
MMMIYWNNPKELPLSLLNNSIHQTTPAVNPHNKSRHTPDRQGVIIQPDVDTIAPVCVHRTLWR